MTALQSSYNQIVSPLSDQSFTPPPIDTGEDVLYYPTGSKNDQPETARVYKAKPNSRSVDLILFGAVNTRKHAVHHIDDPLIKLNHIVEAQGGWDYPASRKVHNEMAAGYNTLVEENARLKEQIADLVKLRPLFDEMSARLNKVFGRLEIVEGFVQSGGFEDVEKKTRK